MAKVTDFLGGQFIKSDEVKASPLVGDITGTRVTEFKDSSGKAERKLALDLIVAGKERAFTLNSANIKTLIAAFGDDDDNWKGRKIVLYFDPTVPFGGKVTGGVRIKVPGVKSEAEKAREAAEAAANAAVAAATTAPTREPGDDDIPF